MASASAIVLQMIYAVAAVLAYILLQKLNDERRKAKRARQQSRLERQKEQQAEVQHRGDSATDIPILSESQRPKELTARSNAAQPPFLPQSVFVPEPTMLDLPSLPSDWEIRPDQLVISKRPDGSPWELGTGAFGKVRQHKDFAACCQALWLLSDLTAPVSCRCSRQSWMGFRLWLSSSCWNKTNTSSTSLSMRLLS